MYGDVLLNVSSLQIFIQQDKKWPGAVLNVSPLGNGSDWFYLRIKADWRLTGKHFQRRLFWRFTVIFPTGQVTDFDTVSVYVQYDNTSMHNKPGPE